MSNTDANQPAAAGSPVEQELGLAEQLRKLWPEGVTQCKWCRGFSRPPCGCPADEEIERLRTALAEMTADRDSWADQASQRTQDALDLMAAERERCASLAHEARRQFEHWVSQRGHAQEAVLRLKVLDALAQIEGPTAKLTGDQRP